MISIEKNFYFVDHLTQLDSSFILLRPQEIWKTNKLGNYFLNLDFLFEFYLSNKSHSFLCFIHFFSWIWFFLSTLYGYWWPSYAQILLRIPNKSGQYLLQKSDRAGEQGRRFISTHETINNKLSYNLVFLIKTLFKLLLTTPYEKTEFNFSRKGILFAKNLRMTIYYQRSKKGKGLIYRPCILWLLWPDFRDGHRV